MLFSSYMQREFADNTRFWYYNSSVQQPNSVQHDTGQQVTSPDLKQQLEFRKFVILLLTEHNLVENEFGFPDRTYHLYHPLTTADQAATDKLARKMAGQAI